MIGIDALASLLQTGINKIWPDKNVTLQEAGKVAEAIHSELQGQIEIDKAEAASPSTFVAGWRPAIGWIGALSLGLVYIPKAVLLSAFWAYQTYLALKAGGPMPPYPDLGLTDVLGLLGSMLGIGTLRTVEKFGGVHNDH